jgi:hypothetical protein
LVRVRLGGRHERMQYVHIHYSTTHTVSDASTTHLVLLTQGSAPSCRCARRSCTLAARCASSSAPGPDAAVASSSSSCVSTHREGKQARAWEPVSMRVSRRRCHLGPARRARAGTHRLMWVGGSVGTTSQPSPPRPTVVLREGTPPGASTKPGCHTHLSRPQSGGVLRPLAEEVLQQDGAELGAEGDPSQGLLHHLEPVTVEGLRVEVRGDLRAHAWSWSGHRATGGHLAGRWRQGHGWLCAAGERAQA